MKILKKKYFADINISMKIMYNDIFKIYIKGKHITDLTV